MGRWFRKTSGTEHGERSAKEGGVGNSVLFAHGRADFWCASWEESSRTLFERTPYPMWIFDVQTLSFLAVNEAAIRHYGYSRQEFLAMTLGDLRPRQTAHLVPTLLLAGELALDRVSEWRHRRKDGSVIDVELVIHEYVFNNRPARLALAIDVTERKRAEAALRESEERYALAVQGSADGLWDWDLITSRAYYSKRWQALLGLQEAELENRMDAFFVRLHPDDVERMRAAMRAHVEQRHPFDVELRLRHRNNEYVWLRMRGQAVWNAEGRATRMAGVISDITKQKWMEHALQQACDELEKRVRERTADLAEANNRLTAKILEYREIERALQVMNETLEERVKERTGAMLTYQQQLRSLASELSRAEERERHRIASELHDNLVQVLAFCKMKLASVHQDLDASGRSRAVEEVTGLLDQALRYTRILMSDLRPTLLGNDDDLQMVIRWVAEKMQRQGLGVTIDDDGEPKSLREDVLIVTYQALQELLFNVLKHAQTRQATVTLRRVGLHLKIVVADQGVGFDASAKLLPSQEGGFGLFNIRERVDLLGGRLEIKSAPGAGTRAILFVPLKPARTSRRKRMTESPSGTLWEVQPPSDSVGVKIRVLLVDDHRIMREGLRSIIEGQADLEVVAEASDGRMAVEVARETRPDVVVMDINMPTMNGLEATRQIKADLPQVKIIGLSVHEDEGMAALMRDAGASAYLSKGSAFETLCATIRELSAKRVQNDERSVP